MIWLVILLLIAVVVLAVIAFRSAEQARSLQQHATASTQSEVLEESAPQTMVDVGGGLPLVAWVVPVTGVSRSKTYVLGSKDTIGRGGRSTVVVMDPHMSEEHAQIQLTEEGFKISDMGSTNGIKINNVAVREQHLLDNDAVALGKTVFRFKTTFR